jgi:hypothetical protein
MRIVDYLIVAEAMAALTLAQGAKIFLPFRIIMADEVVASEGAVLDLRCPPADPRTRAVARLLARADRRIPWHCTCLVQALAARAMLRRRGIASVMRFGLKRDDDGKLAAHAWLEAGGGIVCGGPAAEGYTPLAGFSRRQPGQTG